MTTINKIYIYIFFYIDLTNWLIDYLLVSFVDDQIHSYPEGSNHNYAGTFTMQPSKRALVADMGETAFVQYVTLFLNWSSNSSALQLTMDYSMDGIQWNDYVEDERVKVRRITLW